MGNFALETNTGYESSPIFTYESLSFPSPKPILVLGNQNDFFRFIFLTFISQRFFVLETINNNKNLSRLTVQNDVQRIPKNEYTGCPKTYVHKLISR